MSDQAVLYERSVLAKPDALVIAAVMNDIAQCGYIVDRLKPITAEHLGHCWRYEVPVLKVVR